MAASLLQLSHLAGIRAIKAENARLTAENKALKEEMASLTAHFDMALLAASDLRSGEPVEIWDGWNLVLGAEKAAGSREELIARAKASGRRVWIVFDGHDEKVSDDGKVRISYTGGEGSQRADRFICDYLRMAVYLGLADSVSVRTNDRELLKKAASIKARR